MVMLPYLIVLIVILAALFFVNGKRTEVHDIKTGELIQEIKEENVTEITVTPKSGESVYIVTGKLKDYDDKESFTTRVIPEEIELITKYAEDQKIKEYVTKKDPGSNK